MSVIEAEWRKRTTAWFRRSQERGPQGDKAAAHYGQVGTVLERAGTPCGPHAMQIGAHARSEGLIVVTNNMKEFIRMPGVRVENWV